MKCKYAIKPIESNSVIVWIEKLALNFRCSSQIKSYTTNQLTRIWLISDNEVQMQFYFMEIINYVHTIKLPLSR